MSDFLTGATGTLAAALEGFQDRRQINQDTKSSQLMRAMDALIRKQSLDQAQENRDRTFNRGQLWRTEDIAYRTEQDALEAAKPAKAPGSIEAFWAGQVARGEITEEEYFENRRRLSGATRKPGAPKKPPKGKFLVNPLGIGSKRELFDDGAPVPQDPTVGARYPVGLKNLDYLNFDYQPFDRQPGSGPAAFGASPIDIDPVTGAMNVPEGRQLDPNIGARREQVKASLKQTYGAQWDSLSVQDQELIIQEEMGR